MAKLFFSTLKILFRNRQFLFWSFMFPLMFTFIFGFFFGKGSTSSGTVGLINQSNSELAQQIEKTMSNTSLFKLQKETDVNTAKDLMKKSKIVATVLIPEGFGAQKPDAPTQVTVIDDPANAQANMVVMSFLDKFLTQANYQSQGAKMIFSVAEERTNNRDLNYFDFVLIGLIGMALMNSSIQGVAIPMAKYREDQILKRLTTTPLRVWKFIVAYVLSRLVLNVIQVALILLIGIYLFDAHIYGNVALVFVLSLIGAVLFQSIGFVVASLSKTTAAAEGMSVAISIPMMFLAGVFFPIDQLPKWLYSIVQYLPLAPLLRIIRGVALESTSPFTNPVNIALVLGWIVVALAFSAYKFRLSEE